MSRTARRDVGPEDPFAFRVRVAIFISIALMSTFVGAINYRRENTLFEQSVWVWIVCTILALLFILAELTSRRVERRLRTRIAYESARADVGEAEIARLRRTIHDLDNRGAV